MCNYDYENVGCPVNIIIKVLCRLCEIYARAIQLENVYNEAIIVKVINLAGSTTEFKYGDLISNIIDFLIIALIVFLAYKQLSRLKLAEDKTKPPAEEKK